MHVGSPLARRLAGAAVVLLLTGCTRATPAPRASGIPVVHLSAEQAAARFADDLLSRAHLPSSATKVTPPSALAKQYVGSGPRVDTKVERFAWFEVPLSMNQARLTWLHSPPAGMTHGGHSSGSDRQGMTSVGDQYYAAPGGILEIDAVRGPSAAKTYVWVDSQVVYNPDKTAAETLAGPAREVVVNGRRLEAAAAQRVFAAFNTLVRPVGGVTSCPNIPSGHVDPVTGVVIRTASHVARLVVTEGICASTVQVTVDGVAQPSLAVSPGFLRSLATPTCPPLSGELREGPVATLPMTLLGNRPRTSTLVLRGYQFQGVLPGVARHPVVTVEAGHPSAVEALPVRADPGGIHYLPFLVQGQGPVHIVARTSAGTYVLDVTARC